MISLDRRVIAPGISVNHSTCFALQQEYESCFALAKHQQERYRDTDCVSLGIWTTSRYPKGKKLVYHCATMFSWFLLT